MNSRHIFIAILSGLLLAACGEQSSEPETVSASPASQESAPVTDSADADAGAMTGNAAGGVDSAKLAAVLAMQPEENQQRYDYRHPQETLEFFGIEPGMMVVEALPGGGWYSRILAAYLGPDGTLIGADYPMAMWPNFPFGTPEFIEKRRGWTDTWPKDLDEWPGDELAAVQATRLDEFDAQLNDQVDAVLYIRALHNLNRFEDEGGFRSAALEETYRVLKPGGIVGVVQHRAPDDAPEGWADGSRGYLKQADVIAFFEAAGFELVDQSDINANPKDQPGEEDIVWRLPPSLNTSRDDPELRAKYQAIGESDRMTLLFRKPAAGARKPAAGAS